MPMVWMPASIRRRSQAESDPANGKYTLAADALEDGEQWLQASRAINVCNCCSPPTWAYVEQLVGEVS
ncbi:hypothetical protein LMG919_00395 [Xanthomonas vesicatoria]|uniref:Uncharacterized protein n=2 Tax=Xanthomonas vesicatoria TaxID=56460 RepID=A0AAJ0J1T6_9XANT|nr:hypothetical protein BI313_04715 [Xanthomonas vesicatoria]KHM98407.1 hypothetical protein OR61_01240 [Xanthomonas vesicatoria]KTF34232.1 hypothetical protein LMG920_07025 [Xanthomonas vesicatoria]KTF39045.1 hypothetical protein LMG919_00395 [Xanthomonas vesicatoria]